MSLSLHCYDPGVAVVLVLGQCTVHSVSVQPNDSAGQDLWELIKLIITLQLQPVQRGGFPNLEQEYCRAPFYKH